MRYPGLLSFIPVDVPPFPENINSFSFYEAFQQLNNITAIHSGNIGAGNAIKGYNSQIMRYYDNGEAAAGYTLPTELPDATSFYKPATDATDNYVPPANGMPGYWKPGGPSTVTPPWTLPVGTILFVKQP